MKRKGIYLQQNCYNNIQLLIFVFFKKVKKNHSGGLGLWETRAGKLLENLLYGSLFAALLYQQPQQQPGNHTSLGNTKGLHSVTYFKKWHIGLAQNISNANIDTTIHKIHLNNRIKENIRN